jgi:hypothetical protein
MRVPIQLTRKPIYLTATGAQDIKDVLEVASLRQLDLGLTAYNLTGGGNFTVEIETSMQNELANAELWTSIATFATITGTTPASKPVSVSAKVLKYIRWNVTSLTGTTPTVTFFIEGFGLQD